MIVPSKYLSYKTAVGISLAGSAPISKGSRLLKAKHCLIGKTEAQGKVQQSRNKHKSIRSDQMAVFHGEHWYQADCIAFLIVLLTEGLLLVLVLDLVHDVACLLVADGLGEGCGSHCAGRSSGSGVAAGGVDSSWVALLRGRGGRGRGGRG